MRLGSIRRVRGAGTPDRGPTAGVSARLTRARGALPGGGLRRSRRIPGCSDSRVAATLSTPPRGTTSCPIHSAASRTSSWPAVDRSTTRPPHVTAQVTGLRRPARQFAGVQVADAASTFARVVDPERARARAAWRRRYRHLPRRTVTSAPAYACRTRLGIVRSEDVCVADDDHRL